MSGLVQRVQCGYRRGEIVLGWPLIIGRLKPVQEHARRSCLLQWHRNDDRDPLSLARSISRNAEP